MAAGAGDFGVLIIGLQFTIPILYSLLPKDNLVVRNVNCGGEFRRTGRQPFWAGGTDILPMGKAVPW